MISCKRDAGGVERMTVLPYFYWKGRFKFLAETAVSSSDGVLLIYLKDSNISINATL